jgi:hypothetical protein
MTISTYEVVIYTGIFLVPGFIIDEIVTTLKPIKVYSDSVKALRYIGYSVFNLTVWFWLFYLIKTAVDNSSVWYFLLLELSLLATSAISGVVIGLIRKFELLRKLFARFDINILHPVPTAWDYKFSEIYTEKWVIVTLENDKHVYGKFGYASLASSEKDERDIFLEEIWSLGEDDNWKKRERTDGVWIKATNIKMIEFLN